VDPAGDAVEPNPEWASRSCRHEQRHSLEAEREGRLPADERAGNSYVVVELRERRDARAKHVRATGKIECRDRSKPPEPVPK
jgi:hypothetical protein